MYAPTLAFYAVLAFSSDACAIFFKWLDLILRMRRRTLCGSKLRGASRREGIATLKFLPQRFKERSIAEVTPTMSYMKIVA